MDLQRALTALMRAATPSTQQQNQQPTIQFPFNDAATSAAFLSAALATKLPLGILPPYENATIPTSAYTPTKKAKFNDSTTEPSSPVSSHSSTVSSTNFSSPQQSPHRKLACPIPDEKKDGAYFERRRKNNDAAKRSRDARRQKEEAIASKAAVLEQENIQLRGQIAVLQQETAKLQLLLFSTTSSTANNRVTENIKNESTIEI
ncbi:unnamed protein product [Caenorhabditis angaria]|uniref:BZIP domain-containing protein n=1 Tax=Caenorhabditis angaria TaxID=860376 RepID=A0A9P1I3K9_9PELO|nr:unnamed protein product [Caenorhabditis angaria]